MIRAWVARTFGRLGVGHHQEAHGLQADLAGQAEVLDGDVGLGAVGGDADDRRAEVGHGPDVVGGPDARAASGRRSSPACAVFDRGAISRSRSSVQAEAVVERAAAEAVAVADLDHRHPGAVEGVHDGRHLVHGELVGVGVGAVPQGRVGDADVEFVGVGPGARVASSVGIVRSDQSPGHLLADLGGGRRHDVEVAGVGRQEVAGALDLDEDGHPPVPSSSSNWGRRRSR